MPWSAETAMRQMWHEMDKNVSNGEMMRFFERHLQAAYEAGVNAAAVVAVEFDNCGTDADPNHTIPCEIGSAIKSLVA